jgi:serine phosphatase RsbU (regulator of sigma subunit)
MGQKRKLEKQLAEKTVEIQKQNAIIEEKNMQITSSIQYAKNIQQSILPQYERIEDAFKDAFVIFLPKDIVSGDFYWFNKIGDLIFIAALDCTGHGVPGAFMSLIGNSLLNQIVNENKIYSPEKILEELHKGVRKVLNQEKSGSNSRDGMDVAFCVIEFSKKKINFSGARRPLFMVKENGKELVEIRGDRKSIGGKQREEIREFTKHEISYSSGDSVYLFSDGYIDQQNENEKKFGIKRFREIIDEINTKSMKEQKKILLDELKEHKKNWTQQDDITVLGIKL